MFGFGCAPIANLFPQTDCENAFTILCKISFVKISSRSLFGVSLFISVPVSPSHVACPRPHQPFGSGKMPSAALEAEVRDIAVVSNIRRVGRKLLRVVLSFKVLPQCSVRPSAKFHQFTRSEHAIASSRASACSRNFRSISARTCAFSAGVRAAMLENKAAPNCSGVPFIFASPGIAELLCGSNR